MKGKIEEVSSSLMLICHWIN